VPGKPSTAVDLTWTGGLKFSATTKQSSLTLDSAGVAGPSPVDALAAALAGCMTTDVTDILLKGRFALRGLKSHFSAERAPSDPHRFVSASLHFAIETDAPSAAIERAISLSRDKYCSVWHSMRQDIEFTVTFEVTP
jgi:putative redox protein